MSTITHGSSHARLWNGTGIERGELIPEGKPVTGAVTHLRYRVAKP